MKNTDMQFMDPLIWSLETSLTGKSLRLKKAELQLQTMKDHKGSGSHSSSTQVVY